MKYKRLKNIEIIPNDILEKLLIKNFRFAEHVAAYAFDSQSGIDNLCDYLNIDELWLKNVFGEYDQSDNNSLLCFKPNKLSFGFNFSTINTSPQSFTIDHLPKTVRFPRSASLADIAFVNGIPDQGEHPSCVAWAHGTCAELILGGKNLSKRFFYRVIKNLEGNSTPGSSACWAIQALADFGCCEEHDYPYSEWDDQDSRGLTLPPKTLMEKAKINRLSFGYFSNDSSAILPTIKGLLSGSFCATPRTVPTGIELKSGMLNWFTEATGEINLPLEGEDRIGLHDILPVSYYDDASYAGGGYVSCLFFWGNRWAKKSKDGHGLCRVPYAYFHKHALEVSILLTQQESWTFNSLRRNNEQDLVLKSLSKESLTKGLRTGTTKEGEDIFLDGSSLPNDHIMVAGESGYGKTNFCQLSIAQDAKENNRCNWVYDIGEDYLELASSINNSIILDVIDVGFPFQFLQPNKQIPLDFQVENLLDDLRVSNSQLGAVQLDSIRTIFTELLVAGGCSNEQLNCHLEMLDDPCLKAQIKPFMLLLRSGGFDIKSLIDQNSLIVCNLSKCRNKKTRAAFAIFTNSFLFEYQQQQRRLSFKTELSDGSGEWRKIRCWVEESSTLSGANDQLQIHFQQGRKYQFSGVYN